MKQHQVAWRVNDNYRQKTDKYIVSLYNLSTKNDIDWIVHGLRPRQHSIGYMGDGFYRSKDPTNSIKVLKEKR